MSNPQLKCVQYKVNKNRSSDGNVETDNIIQKNFERIGQSLKSIREQLVKYKELETVISTLTSKSETLKIETENTLNEIKEVLDDHKKAIESLQGVTLMDNA